MNTKIISTLLIYCILIQVLFTGTGCMSFYSTNGDDNLADYKNYDGKILLKLKDGTEAEVPQNGILDIEKNGVDSTKIIEYHSKPYEIYWMKSKRMLLFDMDKSVKEVPDTNSDFWAVVDDHDTRALRKIYDNDIDEIQIQKVNPVTTGLFIFAILASVFAVIAATHLPKKGPYFEWPAYTGSW